MPEKVTLTDVIVKSSKTFERHHFASLACQPDTARYWPLRDVLSMATPGVGHFDSPYLSSLKCAEL